MGDLGLKEVSGVRDAIAQAARNISLRREILVGGLHRQNNLPSGEILGAEPTLNLRFSHGHHTWKGMRAI